MRFSVHTVLSSGFVHKSSASSEADPIVNYRLTVGFSCIGQCFKVTFFVSIVTKIYLTTLSPYLSLIKSQLLVMMIKRRVYYALVQK